jgi:hypothetical protein
VAAPPNPNFMIPTRREPTTSPPSILSPLLSVSVDRVEHDFDSDSSSASGHGWEPILSDTPVHRYGDYSDVGAVSRGFLFEPVLMNEENHFGYEINDYGNPFFDMQGSVDLSNFISGVSGMGDLDTGIKSG